MPNAEGNDQRRRCIHGGNRTRNKVLTVQYCDGLRADQMTAQGVPQFYSGTGGLSERGKQKYLAQLFDHEPMWRSACYNSSRDRLPMCCGMRQSGSDVAHEIHSPPMPTSLSIGPHSSRIVAITSQKIQPKRGLRPIGKGLGRGSIVYIVVVLQINRATSDVVRDASGGQYLHTYSAYGSSVVATLF